jgi:hypothetical protein
MVTALRTVVWRDGIKVGTGGYEVLLLAGAVAVADLGPGEWSLDSALGLERRGARWALAAAGAAAAASALTVAAAQRQPVAAAEHSSPSSATAQTEAATAT